MSNDGWVAPGSEDPHRPGLPAEPVPPAQSPATRGPATVVPPGPPAGAPAPHPAPAPAGGAPVWALAARPGIAPLHPMTLGDILGGAFSLLRFAPRASLLVALVANVLSALVVTPALVWSLQELGRVDDDPAAPVPDGGASVVSNLTQGLAGVVSSFAVLVLCVVASRAVLGERIGAGAAWREFRPSLWRAVALLGLAVAAAVGVALLLLAGFLVHEVLGVVLLVLAGAAALVLTVRLCLVQVALVLERLRPVAAVRRSWALTRGQFWRTLGIVVVTGLVTGVVEMAVALPLSLAGAAAGFALSGPDAGLGPTVVAAGLAAVLAGLVSGVVTTPVQAAVTTLQYVDQRMRKEGFDVVLARAVADRAGDR